MANLVFASTLNLQPADVLVIPKALGTVEHYVVYLGINESGQEVYIENAPDGGVQILSIYQFLEQNQGCRVSRFRKFSGNAIERNEAVKRAISLVSTKYKLFNFNCESFANYVQNGVPFSKQVNNFGKFVAAASLLYTGREMYKAFTGNSRRRK